MLSRELLIRNCRITLRNLNCLFSYSFDIGGNPKMINIAIVDDNKAFLQEMKSNIEACKEFKAEVASDGEARRVPVGSILYIEKTKRGSRLTVEAGAAAGRKTLQSNERQEDGYAQLCEQGFEYAHTSYIVNLGAVTKIMQNELTMSNGDRLGISRTCSK